MALNARQRYFYRYTISIYRLIDPAINPLHDIAAPVMTDFGVYSLLASGIQAQFISTPENDEPTSIGRTKSVNIFTLDQWHVQNSVDVGDTDCILVTGVKGTSPMLGRVWMVQGNPTSHDTLRQSNYQMIYSKLVDNPVPGVDS